MTDHYTLVALMLTGVTLIAGLLNAFMLFRQQAILATMKKEMAELELRIISRLNGLYVRTELCNERHKYVAETLSHIVG
jgi:hypothetical protein